MNTLRQWVYAIEAGKALGFVLVKLVEWGRDYL